MDVWLDELAARELTSLSDADQASLIRELQRIERRVTSARMRVLAEAERAATARRHGAASTAAWAAGPTQTDPQSTFREVRLATEVEDSPVVAQSPARGEISPAHAAVIADAGRRLPPGLSPTQRVVVEQSLVERAQKMSPLPSAEGGAPSPGCRRVRPQGRGCPRGPAARGRGDEGSRPRVAQPP